MTVLFQLRSLRNLIVIITYFTIISAEIYFTMNITLHKVFVYGTLKQGEPNHQWFSKDTQGYYRFLYEAKTKEKFPLIIATKYNIPFILYSPGKGWQVIGEVYEADDKVLANLDILEEHPDFYVRDLYPVTPLNGEKDDVHAWIYVIKKYKQQLLNVPFYEKYSSSGNHGRKYVERYLREDITDYKLETLDE